MGCQVAISIAIPPRPQQAEHLLFQEPATFEESTAGVHGNTHPLWLELEPAEVPTLPDRPWGIRPK